MRLFCVLVSCLGSVGCGLGPSYVVEEGRVATQAKAPTGVGDVEGWGERSESMTQYATLNQPIVVRSRSMSGVNIASGTARVHPRGRDLDGSAVVWSETPGVNVVEVARDGSAPVRVRLVVQDFAFHLHMAGAGDFLPLSELGATEAEVEDDSVARVVTGEDGAARFEALSTGQTMVLLSTPSGKALALLDVDSSREHRSSPFTVDVGESLDFDLPAAPEVLVIPGRQVLRADERDGRLILRGVAPGIAYVVLSSFGDHVRTLRVTVR